MIVYSEGEITNCKADVIVNRVGVYTILDNNFSKRLNKKYPNLYKDFNSYRNRKLKNKANLVGSTQFVYVDGCYICNLFTHNNSLDNFNCKINFILFERAIKKIKKFCQKNNLSVAFPYNLRFKNNSKESDKVLDIIYKHFLETNIDCYLLISKQAIRNIDIKKRK